MADILELLHIQSLVINAVIASIVISAGNVFSKKVEGVNNNWLVLVISVLVTVLSTAFDSAATFADWQRLILSMLLTMAFSVLFYNFLGQYTVDRLFQWVKNTIAAKINPPPVP